MYRNVNDKDCRRKFKGIRSNKEREESNLDDSFGEIIDKMDNMKYKIQNKGKFAEEILEHAEDAIDLVRNIANRFIAEDRKLKSISH